MNEQEQLRQCLERAVSAARKNRNTINSRELSQIFGELFLSNEQLSLVKDYLAAKKIRVLTDEQENLEIAAESDDLDLDDDDREAIDFYYEEVKALPYLTDREKERIKRAAMEGDTDAQKKVVSMYLPQVIEIAKLYSGQGIPIEDLIGEGNIALVMGAQLLNCVENIEDFDGHIGRIIMDALDALVKNEMEDEKLIIKMGNELKKQKEKGGDTIKLTPPQEDLFNGDELLKEAFIELSKDEGEDEN